MCFQGLFRRPALCAFPGRAGNLCRICLLWRPLRKHLAIQYVNQSHASPLDRTKLSCKTQANELASLLLSTASEGTASCVQELAAVPGVREAASNVIQNPGNE